ncbi:MAG TPA: 2-hydroxyacyl-CoA dehydratase [Spirochaetia bacterium]|nr:2-hydroxyacyl-CoA dehydratase [Spirochaetia bacterium]
MRKIGLTTTVPVEIIYAAGLVPVDLNNLFITAENRSLLIEEAETAGYPRNTCAWIKGIYGVICRHPEISAVVAVTQGDCSNTQALMETLQLRGVEVIPFAYPWDRDYATLQLAMDKLAERCGADRTAVAGTTRRLDEVRELVWELDRLVWEENLGTGLLNHLYQVNCSDFQGDPEAFAAGVAAEIERLTGPAVPELRLGYLGVPPIVDDLYDYLEEQGARVVFNEVQRQFTLPSRHPDLVERYREYTYPYGIFFRLADIEREAARRRLDGVIHYAQSFCFRQIEDMIVRKQLRLPVLTLEGDRPGAMDARTRLRLDAFLDMLRLR